MSQLEFQKNSKSKWFNLITFNFIIT